jgi:alkylation response protein AidB-like acyl-CoA dehydrogenase
MDLAFSKEEIAFREEVRAFFRDNVPPETRRKMVEGRHLSKDEMVAWWRILNKKGWGCSHWPKEYGGTGWTSVQHYIFNEELRASGAGAARLRRQHGVVIYTFGNETRRSSICRASQCRRLVVPGLFGPGSGSDLASLKTRPSTRATSTLSTARRPDHAGPARRLIFCLCRTDTNAEADGHLLHRVRHDVEGRHRAPVETIDGGREVNEVFFDDVEVPVEFDRRGEQGLDYAKFCSATNAPASPASAFQGALRRIKELASSRTERQART